MSKVFVQLGMERNPLDSDWVEMIREARSLGLTIGEVQAYLGSFAQLDRGLTKYTNINAGAANNDLSGKVVV